MSDARVDLDERIRLVAMVLAAGSWPALEQNRRGAHAVHPQAKAIRHALAGYTTHAAVATADRYLAENVSPTALFTVAVRSTWPDFRPEAPIPRRLQGWPAQLAAFREEAAPAPPYWAEQQPAWVEAIADLEEIFAGAELAAYLEQLLGRPLAAGLVVVPNLLYPALETVAVAGEGEYYLIIPPPKAVGESPPWPYRDEEEGILASACYHALALALAGTLDPLPPPQAARFRHAATALFLERAVDETASRFYQLRRRREEGVAGLAEAMVALRLFLDGQRPGQTLDLFLAGLA